MTTKKATYVVAFRPDGKKGFKVEEAKILSDQPIQVRETNRFSNLINSIQKLIVDDLDKKLEAADAETEKARNDLEEKEQLLAATEAATKALLALATDVVSASKAGNGELLTEAIRKLGEFVER
jgi:hypothetical protein